MNGCEKIKEWFDEAYYGELTADELSLFESHLESCPECAGEYRRFRAALEGLKACGRPELEDGYWDRYMDRLENTIASEAGQSTPWPVKIKEFFSSLFPAYPMLRPLVSAAALIAVGIVIGRYLLNDGNQTIVPSGPYSLVMLEDGGNAHLRAARYFDRAKLVILGIVNYETDTDELLRTSFDRQVQISRELVDEIPVLKAELSPRADAALLRVISELETILLQTANLEDNYGIVDIKLIQQGAQRKALLFKIDIGESILSNQKSRPNASTGGNGKSAARSGGILL